MKTTKYQLEKALEAMASEIMIGIVAASQKSSRNQCGEYHFRLSVAMVSSIATTYRETSYGRVIYRALKEQGKKWAQFYAQERRKTNATAKG